MKRSDVRTILWGAILIGVIFIVVALVEKWKSRDYEPWLASRIDLQRIGTTYRDFHKQHHRPPANFEELDDIERNRFTDQISTNLSGARDDFEIYWNTPLSEDDADNVKVMLGYAKKFTSRGVVVLHGNGVTTTVSVREFEDMKKPK
jgi:hypothetical protein